MHGRDARLLWHFGLLLLVVGLVTLTMWNEDASLSDGKGESQEGVAQLDPAERLNGLQSSLRDFRQWLARDGTGALSEDKLELGLSLARERREVMLHLMRENPEEALKQSVTLLEYDRLPEAMKPFVEEPFSEQAMLRVLPACSAFGASGEAALDQVVEVEFQDAGVFQVSLHGQRRGSTSKKGVALQGVRLDGLAAISDQVFTPIEARDVPAMMRRFGELDAFDCKQEAAVAQPTFALAGGQWFEFADVEQLREANDLVLALDRLPGPQSASNLLLALPYVERGARTLDLEGLEVAAQEASSQWTEQPKSVFVIRADFPDLTSLQRPLPTATAIEDVFEGAVSQQISEMSYGKTSISAEASPEVVRLPKLTSVYSLVDGMNSSQNSLLLNDAKTAYQNLVPTWDPDDYDIVGVYFEKIGMRIVGLDYGGLAVTGGADLWLQGNLQEEVITHELGHNYGLGHASWWTLDPEVTDPAALLGANEEYGDIYDIMGGGELPGGHFGVQGKSFLNWISEEEWTDGSVSGSGDHRIGSIDGNQAIGTRGVRLVNEAGGFYWVSCRRKQAGESLNYGTFIQWQRPGENRAWLIDMTPNSAQGDDDKADCALLIGTTFSDFNSGVHITPLGRGGLPEEEWVDVRINVGAFPENQPPNVEIAVPSVCPARTTVLFEATASDPDGDELAYSWAIDGIRVADNHPVLPYAWSLGGSYVVSLTVTDMKGGTRYAEQAVEVTDTIGNWSTLTTSEVVDWTGISENGSRLVLVGENLPGNPFHGAWAWSDDGEVWNSGAFGPNEHAQDLANDGSRFVAVGEKYDFAAPAGWKGFVTTSTNGSDWTEAYFEGGRLREVAFGNGVFVAGGDEGTLIRSEDGLFWSNVPAAPIPSTHRVGGVAFGSGMFVITAHEYSTVTNNFSGNARVYTSSDGLQWTDQTAQTQIDEWKDLRRVHSLEGAFFASGWFSQLNRTSSAASGFQGIRPEYEEFPAMAYGRGVFLAAGFERTLNSPNSPTPKVIVSQNGNLWSELSGVAEPGMNRACFFNDSFFVVGDGDLIRKSASISLAASEFVDWRREQFPDRDANSLMNGDADLDRIQTLIEYGLGSSPVIGGQSGGVEYLPTSGVNESNPLLEDRLVLAFSLPSPARADLIYRVEVADSVSGDWTALVQKAGDSSWEWLEQGESRVESTLSDGRETVKVGDAISTAQAETRFMKLVVRLRPLP